MFIHATIVSVLVAAAAAFPTSLSGRTNNNEHGHKSCVLPAQKLALPVDQADFHVPTLSPSIFTLGVGTQNYTCKDGTYSNIGAVATIYDISCLVGTPWEHSIQDEAIYHWKSSDHITPDEVMAKFEGSFLLGDHYFITNPLTGEGISPKWDFTSQSFKGNDWAFITATKSSDFVAPTGPQDIAWLYLTHVEGALAAKLYRTDTREGQPPATCSHGSPDITVKYVSKYIFYGGSVGSKDYYHAQRY